MTLYVVRFSLLCNGVTHHHANLYRDVNLARADFLLAAMMTGTASLVLIYPDGKIHIASVVLFE
jgi:hypothetical protein